MTVGNLDLWAKRLLERAKQRAKVEIDNWLYSPIFTIAGHRISASQLVRLVEAAALSGATTWAVATQLARLGVSETDDASGLVFWTTRHRCVISYQMLASVGDDPTKIAEWIAGTIAVSELAANAGYSEQAIVGPRTAQEALEWLLVQDHIPEGDAARLMSYFTRSHAFTSWT